MVSKNLSNLFSPTSIGVVGASPNSKYATGLINTLGYGFDGAIYPINPKRDEVWGMTCYDSVRDVPEVVDLVVVNVPRESVVGVIQESGEIGVPSAIVITAGFSEADERGRELENKLAEVCERYEIALCGPNCLGFANVHESIVVKGGSTPRKPDPGSIALISQSGALSFNTFFETAADQDIHFSHIISTGNESVLTTTDYIRHLSEDPNVRVICTFTEGIDDPKEFLNVTDQATRSGTPVLTVKIGRSARAQEATLSHTGSLVGRDDAWNAGFDQTGVQRVADIPDLLSQSSAHAEYDPPSSNRTCIVSTSGGLTSLLADMATQRDILMPDITGQTEQALLDMEELLTFGEVNNPADIRGYGAEILPEIAEILFEDSKFDSYVFALGISAVDERADRIVGDILSISERATDPVLFLWTGRKDPDEIEGLQPYERVRKEIPLYYDPSRCMDALASLVRASESKERLATRPSRTQLGSQLEKKPTFGGPKGSVLGWSESVELLSEYDIEFAESRVATDADAAERVAEEIESPFVVKVDSPEVPHRAKLGGVRVGVERSALKEAYQTIIETVTQHTDTNVARVIVQRYIPDGVEVLIGIVQDDAFGPLVTVGPGGSFVEELDDKAIRVPPISIEEAYEAIDETILSTLLDDNEEDREALARTFTEVSVLAAENNSIAELDLNPVVVQAGKAVAVDILVRTR